MLTTTTGSGPSSPTSRFGDVEQIANRVGREGELWQETHSWAESDHLGEVGLGVGGHEDHRERCRRRAMKPLGEFEAALGAQRDVYQRDVGVQFTVKPQRFSTIGRHTDNADPRAFEHRARGVAKFRAVVNDQAAHAATRGNSQPQLRRCGRAPHTH